MADKDPPSPEQKGLYYLQEIADQVRDDAL